MTLMNLVSAYGLEPTQEKFDAIYSKYLEDCERSCKTVPGGNTPTHKHVKRGGEYVFIGYGKMQAESWCVFTTDVNHAEGREYAIAGKSVDMLEVAIYRAVEDGSLWVRPKDEFEDGRFIKL